MPYKDIEKRRECCRENYKIKKKGCKEKNNGEMIIKKK